MPVEIDVSKEETIESHSNKILQGLLFASIFTLFSIGVGAGLGLAFNLGSNLPEEPPTLQLQADQQVYELVPVSEFGKLTCLDTEQGTIIITHNIDDDLPLHLTPEWVAAQGWVVTAESTGGYNPFGAAWSDFADVIILSSEKQGQIGMLDLTWAEVGYIDPCTTVWEATVSLQAPLIIESNQWPNVPGFGVTPKKASDTIPGKKVKLELHSIWAGCDLEDQSFTIISVHKIHD